jgi:hypothetical protein
MIKQYLKKPLPIKALQFTEENASEMVGWLLSNNVSFSMDMGIQDDHSDTTITIQTLEGFETQPYGVWIAEGVKGEFYPIQDDVFKQSYDEVKEQNHGIGYSEVLPAGAR